MEVSGERSSKHKKLGFEFGHWVSIDEIQFEELEVSLLDVMYVPERHGGAERREQRGQRGQREQRQTGVGFSLCAAPSCPCALYFRVRVRAERRLGRDERVTRLIQGWIQSRKQSRFLY
jgi:hypothetical protein